MRQQKTELTYSTTGGISRAKPALGTLIVCIIQVPEVDASDLCQPFACPDRLGAVVSKQYLLGTEAPFIVGRMDLTALCAPHSTI